MISYIILENFKSFKKIKLDLRNANKMPKKIAFIYGENGSGKTNLVASIFFLRKTFETLAAQEKLKSFDESNLNDLIEGIDNNAKKNIYESIIKNTFKTLESLINDYKMIGSTQNMVIEIGFYLDNKEGIYTLKFDNEKIVSESLYFTINKRVGEIFSITKDSILLNDSIFIETKYKKELLEEIKKYWGKHSFMSIIFYEMNIKNNEYFNSNLNSNFISVISMLKKLTVLYKTKESREAIFSIPFKFLSNLESGIINT
ncbi:MAG: hypothetical protein JJE21_08010, partial [Spirochaetaceae bacterium]|nr:hypothetical protein [Spirochaetaceae bacterium]